MKKTGKDDKRKSATEIKTRKENTAELSEDELKQVSGGRLPPPTSKNTL